jgi:hypothetical protein
MFDNLREASGGSDLYDERDQGVFARAPRSRGGRILGLTPGQRLVISILLFLTVLIMGVMCLLVTGRVFI